VDATNQNDLHGASSPDPDPEPSLTVAQLDGISSTDPKDMAVVFMNSLNVIYQYGFKDIDDVLQHFSMDVLNTLHHDLCAKVSTMFPQYKDKRSVNRQAKHKAVSDICALGYSIVNKKNHKDIEKVFTTQDAKNNGTDEILNANDYVKITKLLEVVTNLTNSISAL
jgi:hypothetical protein